MEIKKDRTEKNQSLNSDSDEISSVDLENNNEKMDKQNKMQYLKKI